MGPDNLSNIRDADRFRSEGPDRKLLSEKDFRITAKDEAKEDAQKKRKNVADKSKFAKAVDAVNLKAEMDENVESKTASPSIFDLAKRNQSQVEVEGLANEMDAHQAQSYSQLEKAPHFESGREAKIDGVSAESAKSDTENLDSGVDSKKKDSQNLSSHPLVNPLVAKTELASIYTPQSPAVQPVNMIDRIKEIVDQIGEIDLYSIKEGGKTETAIVLNGINKMFDGARVVVSSYDTARNEFNITFENLTQQAKYLLDLPKNQEALMQALAQKGEWVVHQVTTTTVVEHRPYLGDTQLAKQDRRQEEEGFEGQGRQKRQKR